MNLHYLAQKRDRHLVLTDGAAASVQKVAGAVWRGFLLMPDEAPQVRLRGATSLFPFRSRPETVGWYMSARKGRATLNVQFTEPQESGSGFGEGQAAGEALVPVRLPWGLAPVSPERPLDLVIHAPRSNSGPVFLAIHKALDRGDLLALCRGRGVEIGPGPKPQILPTRVVDVTYIEQMPSEDWRRLYGQGAGVDVDASLWDHYQVGEAHDLPVPDGSLDFIFSSHVFEHLVNPLGHLQVWRRKLRPGGRIVAVVPDFVGSKDYAVAPSDMTDVIAEYKVGVWALTREHYRRYACARGLADEGEAMWSERRSIHAHYYSHDNMAQLLDEATRRFGFSGFAIRHTPNHKDFHVVVVR